jgi:hypothetical protein
METLYMAAEAEVLVAQGRMRHQIVEVLEEKVLLFILILVMEEPFVEVEMEVVRQ